MDNEIDNSYYDVTRILTISSKNTVSKVLQKYNNLIVMLAK